MMTLSERLHLELRNRTPSEITELILDNSKANEIEGLDDTYTNLRELSLVNVGLTTLQGFPSLPNLEKLDLSDNKISFGLENLVKCPNLCQLLLTNNRVKSIKDIECLIDLKQLKILDLFNCAISFEENYRKDVFALIPTLKYLDGFDEKNEEELNESEEYEEEENEPPSDIKEAYDITDDSGSEEYESEEEVEIINSNHKASKTGGKDMNLFSDEIVELSDGDEIEDIEGGEGEKDGEDEEEQYEEGSFDENDFCDVVETNGKSKTVGELNERYHHLSGSEEDDDDDEEDDLSDNDESDVIENNLNDNEDSVSLGLIDRKRTYADAFNDKFNYDEDSFDDDDDDDDRNVKMMKNNSDFDLTDDSSLLDKV